jgi:hypothetical protein
MLLGVPDVLLVLLETCCLVHHNQVVTLASVWAHVLVPAVAREFLAVFGDDIAVEFGVEVFAHVGEMVVRH